MREYLIVHSLQRDLWTSLTIDADDTHALVVRGEHISTVAYDTAVTILDYCRQSADFIVSECFA